MAKGDGLVTMTPTSIAVAGAGSSASINSDGGVDFTSATSLSLNGVFTSSFDNYLIVCGMTYSISSDAVNLRLRTSGSDATAGNYAYQILRSYASSTAGSRSTSQTEARLIWTGTRQGGFALAIYGPNLAQATAYRTITSATNDNAEIYDLAGTHSLSTSYDGLSLIPISPNTFTGNVVVFGYEE